MKLRILLFTFPLFCLQAYGQNLGSPTPPAKYYSYRSTIGAIGGIHQGRHTFGEIGIGYGHLEDIHGYFFWGVTGSIEFNPWNDVYGAKIGVWKSIPILPLSFGLSTTSYFQYGAFDQVLQPAIGIAYKYLHLTYGYNIRLDPRSITQRNTHQVSLRYHLPVITLKQNSEFYWMERDKEPVD